MPYHHVVSAPQIVVTWFCQLFMFSCRQGKLIWDDLRRPAILLARVRSRWRAGSRMAQAPHLPNSWPKTSANLVTWQAEFPATSVIWRPAIESQLKLKSHLTWNLEHIPRSGPDHLIARIVGLRFLSRNESIGELAIDQIGPYYGAANLAHKSP